VTIAKTAPQSVDIIVTLDPSGAVVAASCSVVMAIMEGSVLLARTSKSSDLLALATLTPTQKAQFAALVATIIARTLAAP